MAKTGARLPITADAGGAATRHARPAPPQAPAEQGPENPWRILLRLQDRHRYLRILEPSPATATPAGTATGTEAGTAAEAELDLDAPMARADHHLLRSPAAMTRSGTNFPDPRQMADYLTHSADATMRGGAISGVVYPLAACALAEHYVFRRLGGSSTGAVAAAMTAAAELGRTAGGPEQPRLPAVQPGFAGLAQTLGWLAGQDQAGPAMASPVLDGDMPPWPEQHRLARLFQPSRTTRDAFRALVAMLRMPKREGLRGRWFPVCAALLAASTRPARLVTALVWLGALAAWLGLTAMLWQQVSLSIPVVAVTSLSLLATFVLAAGTATVVANLAALRTLLAEQAELEHFGLVPGVALPDMESARRPMSGLLDRLVGVPEAGDVPALVTWLADRIDDLAGVEMPDGSGLSGPAGDRPTLTFGELWLGRLGPPSADQVSLLRRAADDPKLRTIDLAMITTNVSQSRPYTLPFLTAERAEREGASRFLFCRNCLTAVLPVRVVSQMILASPAQARESTCPRHDGELLQEVPEPWDFPVVAAVRLSMSLPGLLRAVPLYTLDVESRGTLQDAYGRALLGPPPPTTVYAPRVQWFSDGGLTSDFPVHFFDTLMPRWPTFGFNLDHLQAAPTEHGGYRLAEWVSLPEQDAEPRARSWRRVSELPTFASALLGTTLGWRDSMQADLPGFRGRVAVIRQAAGEGGANLFMPQGTILQLALRGYHASVALRDRFTGQDGEVAGQTQTDRYRWIRLRTALREYRGLSLDIGSRLPLYSDLAANYKVPGPLTGWFTPPIAPGTIDPAWPDAAAAVTHLRALSTGGVLDWDTDYGAPPVDPDLRISPLE
jgi:predicted acylesterase/phospholipase RssA